MKKALTAPHPQGPHLKEVCWLSCADIYVNFHKLDRNWLTCIFIQDLDIVGVILLEICFSPSVLTIREYCLYSFAYKTVLFLDSITFQLWSHGNYGILIKCELFRLVKYDWWDLPTVCLYHSVFWALYLNQQKFSTALLIYLGNIL